MARVSIGRMPDRLPPAQPRLAASSKPVDPFYRSPEWVTLAAAVKRARVYVCDGCGEDYASRPWLLTADHIIARKDGGASLDPLNVQVLCPRCDNAKRAVEHMDRGRGG